MSEPIITVGLDIRMVQRLRSMSLKYEDIPEDVENFVGGIEEDILRRPAANEQVLAWKMRQLGGDMLDFMFSATMAENLAVLREDMDRFFPVATAQSA